MELYVFAVAQHEKAAGRSLSNTPLPIFAAATWMTGFILQNFYCTLQVSASTGQRTISLAL